MLFVLLVVGCVSGLFVVCWRRLMCVGGVCCVLEVFVVVGCVGCCLLNIVVAFCCRMRLSVVV